LNKLELPVLFFRKLSLVSLAFGIALYFMIWWMVLFAVLPFGVRTQGEAGDVVPGTPASAPARPIMIRLFAANSVLAAIVFAGVWYALDQDWMHTATTPPPPPGVTSSPQ
jgi:predicted secreted protein